MEILWILQKVAKPEPIGAIQSERKIKQTIVTKTNLKLYMKHNENLEKLKKTSSEETKLKHKRDQVR